MPHFRFFVLLSVIALSLSAVGCSSDGGSSSVSKSMKASDSIMDTAKRLEDGRAQIDKVVASLNKITSASPSQDLRPLFKDYASNVDKLDKIAQRVKKQADDMRMRGQAYFKDWDAQIAKINNQEIRDQSAQRRTEVEQAFARINEKSQALGEAYRPLMSDLQDIRTALSTDLTAAGVTAIRPMAERVSKEAITTKDAAGAVEAEFRALGVRMSADGK